MTMCLRWLDPAARAAYLAEVGPERYAADLMTYRRRSIAATVNGHDIRPYASGNAYGMHFEIDGQAFDTLALAEAAALEMPPGTPLLP